MGLVAREGLFFFTLINTNNPFYFTTYLVVLSLTTVTEVL